MMHAHVVVELLPQDTSGQKLMQSLARTLDVACTGIHCTLEPKRDFPIAPTLEGGVASAVTAAQMYAAPWCVYMSPRRLLIRLNGNEHTPLSSVIIAVTRHSRPVALFLQTIAYHDVPEGIENALSQRVNDLRERVVTEALTNPDELVVERFRTAIENAYIGAFAKSSMN